MKTLVLLCLIVGLFPILLQVSTAQTPGTLSSAPCLFCAPSIHPHSDRFVFRSPCPDVLSSYAGEALSYLELSVYLEPHNHRGALLDSYYRYVCNCREWHQMLQANYRKWLTGIGAPRLSTAVSSRSLAFKSVSELRPYDRFKTDAVWVQNGDPWGGLGLIAVDVIRDIWIRN